MHQNCPNFAVGLNQVNDRLIGYAEIIRVMVWN